MKEYSARLKIDAPAAKVLMLVTTKEYTEKEAVKDGAFSATATVNNSCDNKVTIVTERVDPSRGPTGKKDMKKKEKSVITSEWDLTAMRSKWRTKVPGMEKIVRIEGSTWIEPAGDCCHLCEKGCVSIGVPFIGDIIAKSLAGDIKKNFSAKKGLIENMLG